MRNPRSTTWKLALAPWPRPPDKPRLLVLNQYYWPGVEATAQLLTDLCEALADEYEIRVLTGMLHGHELLPHRVERNGVEIVRVHSTAFERSRLGLRGLNYVSYLGSSLVTALAGPRPDLVLCMTDPPMIGDVGLAVVEALRRAAARDQRGRLPRDRDQAAPAREPRPRRRPAPARPPLPQARRPGRRDRRDDAAAPRGEGRARSSGCA